MNDRTTSGMRIGAVAALSAILVVSVVMYLRARDSERGTHRDDSPAAEVGAARNDDR